MRNKLFTRLSSIHPAYFVMGGLAILGTVVTFASTPWGVLVDFDSYYYLRAADSLLLGHGFGYITSAGATTPLTHYPPLYSTLLALFSLLAGRNMLVSARITACLLFGLNAFIFGWLSSRYTRSAWTGAAVTALFTASTVTLGVIVAGLSEGLFFIFVLLALFSVAEVLYSESKAWLIVAAFCSAFASLTRYVGIGVILAGGLAILLLGRRAWKNRIAPLLAYAVIGSLPLGLWDLRNLLLTGTTTNRVLSFHWLGGQVMLNEAVYAASSWFLANTRSLARDKLFLLGVGLVAALALGLWGYRLRKQEPTPRERAAFGFAWVLILFILVYCLVLLFSRTFVDFSTPWDTRILSPLYLTAGLLIPIVLWNGFQASRQLWAKLFLLIPALYLLYFYLPQSVQFLRTYAIEGRGYTSAAMQSSQAIAFLKSYPARGELYSNNAPTLYFNMGRLASTIPEKYDRVKNAPNADFEQNLAAMRLKLKTPGSFLVIFKPYGNFIEYPPLSELTAGLVVVVDYEEATIYAYP